MDAVDGWHKYDNGSLEGPKLMAARRAETALSVDRYRSVAEPARTWRMRDAIESALPPIARANDIPRVRNALQQAVRVALIRHKLAGQGVAAWRRGRVEWTQSEDITIPSDLEAQ